jgi:hypothetical protein
MPEHTEVRVRWSCGLCGKPIEKDQQIATLAVTRRTGGQAQVEIHAQCVKPHVDKATVGEMIDEAATVEERQRIWDTALSKSR